MKVLIFLIPLAVSACTSIERSNTLDKLPPITIIKLEIPF